MSSYDEPLNSGTHGIISSGNTKQPSHYKNSFNSFSLCLLLDSEKTVWFLVFKYLLIMLAVMKLFKKLGKEISSLMSYSPMKKNHTNRYIYSTMTKRKMMIKKSESCFM